MSLHLPRTLAACAAAVLLLAGCDGSSSAQATEAPTPSPSPDDPPRVIAYAGGESAGVWVHDAADRQQLHGAPRSFKRFAGRTAERTVAHSACAADAGLMVEALRTDGYAVGGVSDCGGYAALWAVVDGRWKEIQGTQDSWRCRGLHRYRVPSDIAGDTCYDYRAHRQRHYHQA